MKVRHYLMACLLALGYVFVLAEMQAADEAARREVQAMQEPQPVATWQRLDAKGRYMTNFDGIKP